MKYWKHYALATATFGLLWSCSGSAPTEEEPTSEPVETCFYKYNEASTSLEWTSFKYTDKAPVKGTFNDMTVSGTLEGDDIMTILKSLSVEINTESVETQNEDRNGKIYEHFFQTLETNMMTANVVSLGEDGSATISINLHNMSKDVVGTYTWEDDVFTFNGTMDVNNWDGMAGINALNEVCKDLHTGEDGVSKLWPTIDLMFSTTFISDCN